MRAANKFLENRLFGRGGRGVPGRNSPTDILQNCERAAAKKTESRVIPGSSINFHPAHVARNDAELVDSN